MALFPWPSWSSLVLETLLRRPLFFSYKRAYWKRAQSWTGSIFSKTLRKDQKVVVFLDGRCTFSLGWHRLSCPEASALSGFPFL